MSYMSLLATNVVSLWLMM